MPTCDAGLHTLQELQKITDSFLDDDMLKNEAIRIQKLAERRAEASAGHTAPCCQASGALNNDSLCQQLMATRSKAVPMMQAAGTAHAVTAVPARQLMQMLHESGAFAAPPLVSGKRCGVFLWCCRT